MPKFTITLPNDPETLDEWQNAVDAADALLRLEAARMYGLVTGAPRWTPNAAGRSSTAPPKSTARACRGRRGAARGGAHGDGGRRTRRGG